MAVFCNVKDCRSVWYRPRWRAPRAGGSARSARALAVYPLNTTGGLIYRVHHARRRRNDKRKGVTETDCARLLDATLANLAKRNLTQLTALIKTRLRRMQYRPGLLDGFLASSGLDLTPFCNSRN